MGTGSRGARPHTPVREAYTHAACTTVRTTLTLTQLTLNRVLMRPEYPTLFRDVGIRAPALHSISCLAAPLCAAATIRACSAAVAAHRCFDRFDLRIVRPQQRVCA